MNDLQYQSADTRAGILAMAVALMRAWQIALYAAGTVFILVGIASGVLIILQGGNIQDMLSAFVASCICFAILSASLIMTSARLTHVRSHLAEQPTLAAETFRLFARLAMAAWIVALVLVPVLLFAATRTQIFIFIPSLISCVGIGCLGIWSHYRARRILRLLHAKSSASLSPPGAHAEVIPNEHVE